MRRKGSPSSCCSTLIKVAGTRCGSLSPSRYTATPLLLLCIFSIRCRGELVLPGSGLDAEELHRHARALKIALEEDAQLLLRHRLDYIMYGVELKGVSRELAAHGEKCQLHLGHKLPGTPGRLHAVHARHVDVQYEQAVPLSGAHRLEQLFTALVVIDARVYAELPDHPAHRIAQLADVIAAVVTYAYLKHALTSKHFSTSYYIKSGSD